MMRRMLLAGAWLVASAGGALAHPVDNGPAGGVPELLLNGAYDYAGYEAQVVEVLDAGTIRLNINIWPGQIMAADVATPGIQTPDSVKHECAQQKEFAAAALNSIKRSFPAGSWVYVNDVALKGGKVSANVVSWGDGGFTSIADILMSQPGRWGVSSDDPPFDWCWGQE